MDVVAEIRDTYNSIGPAWDGLLHSVHNIYDYYRTLDYTSLRLTNITNILPAPMLMDVDFSVLNLQRSLCDFNAAVDGMAFQTDMLTRGNYGPFNPYIRLAYAELARSVVNSGYVTTQIIDHSVKTLDDAKKQSTGTSSDAAYLSNITSATHNIIANQELRVQNEKVRNLALALYITERDAKDWITYRNHMRHMYKETPSAVAQSRKKGSFLPVFEHFQSPYLFEDNLENVVKNDDENDK
jgi:hypothetical protein